MRIKFVYKKDCARSGNFQQNLQNHGFQPVSSTNFGFTLIKLRVTSTKVTVLPEIAPKMQATMKIYTAYEA